MEKETLMTSEFDQLLVRCIDGSASDNDYTTAWEWIQQSDQHKTHYEDLRDAWLSVSVFQTDKNQKADQSWMQFRKKNAQIFKRPDNSTMFKTILRIAAIFILAFILGGLSFRALLR